MSLTQQTGHVADARTNFVEQFKLSSTLQTLMDTYTIQIQDLENALFQVLNAVLNVATGATLDGYGDIVGEDRGGRDDATYRAAIQSRIQLNTSNGTSEEIIAFLLGLAGGTNTVDLQEFFPAGFIGRFIDRIQDDEGIGIATLLQQAKPAAVRAILWWFESDIPFGFLGDGDASGFGVGEFAAARDS